MINKPIETYKDMRRAQNTYKFANYFPEMDNGTLNFIFDFVEDEKNKVVGEHEKITFYVSNKVVKTIPKKMDANSAKTIKEIYLYSGIISYAYVTPTRTYSSSGGYSSSYSSSYTSSYTSYSSSSSSSSYSSGRSSNNNNNNN